MFTNIDIVCLFFNNKIRISLQVLKLNLSKTNFIKYFYDIKGLLVSSCWSKKYCIFDIFFLIFNVDNYIYSRLVIFTTLSLGK